jgi:hypothetical protein
MSAASLAYGDSGAVREAYRPSSGETAARGSDRDRPEMAWSVMSATAPGASKSVSMA